jgi:hypothetical protein
VSILNCDFFLLLDCPAVFGFPLAYEILSPLPIAELQRLTDFLAADCPINPNRALAVAVLSAPSMLLAALAMTAIDRKHWASSYRLLAAAELHAKNTPQESLAATAARD